MSFNVYFHVFKGDFNDFSDITFDITEMLFMLKHVCFMMISMISCI